MQICHSDVDTFRKSVGSSGKRPISKHANYRRSFSCRDLLILYIPRESQDDCLHVDFECFKLELWPTLRQKFMNFWSFLTHPGDKHDAEKISNCSSTPKRSWSKLTILPWVSRCFNFSHDKTPNLIVLSEISFWNEMFFCSIKPEMFTVAES